MDNVEIISFAVSVGLAAASIVLAAFAIWLSREQAKDANSALDSVRTLAAEIRSLVKVAVSQQEQFSTKMLDSILDTSRYGQPVDQERPDIATIVEGALRERLAETESRLTREIEANVRRMVALPSGGDENAVQRLTESIRADVREMVDSTASTVSASLALPASITEALRSYRKYPAYFLVLDVIIKENIHSEEEFGKHAERNHVPEGWEVALLDFIEKGILEGELERFDVRRDLKVGLSIFLSANADRISQIREIYSGKEGAAGVTPDEREIGGQFWIGPAAL